MPNTTDSPNLLLCNGKDRFRKANAEYLQLMVVAADAGLRVGTVRCQGACAGPTAVVIGPDGPRWFEDLKGAKVQRALCAFAQDVASAIPKRLAKRELAGKSRKQAAKRLAKQR